VNIGVAVGIGDLFVVNFAEPIVGGDGAGVAEDQTADRIGNGGVFLDTPVVDIDVVINGVLVVKIGILGVAEFFTLLTIKDICLGDVCISGLNQNGFNAVLNIFNGDLLVFYFTFKIGSNFKGKEVYNIGVVLLFLSLKCLSDSIADFGNIKLYYLSVSL